MCTGYYGLHPLQLLRVYYVYYGFITAIPGLLRLLQCRVVRNYIKVITDLLRLSRSLLQRLPLLLRSLNLIKIYHQVKKIEYYCDYYGYYRFITAITVAITALCTDYYGSSYRLGYMLGVKWDNEAKPYILSILFTVKCRKNESYRCSIFLKNSSKFSNFGNRARF